MSNREIRVSSIESLQDFQKICENFTLVAGMGADDTGDLLFAVEWRPGKFAIVVVEKARGDTDALMGDNVGECGRVVVAVEMFQVKFR